MSHSPVIHALQKAIKRMHGCESRHLETVHVHETHEGKTVWEGDVEVFGIVGHPSATIVYAWSEATTGTKRRFLAVLRVPTVDSPAKAVQASIFADVQELERAKTSLN